MPNIGVIVFESRHSPKFKVTGFRQQFSEFLLIESGQARLIGPETEIRLSTNVLAHIPAGVEFSFIDSPESPIVLFSLQYRAELLDAKMYAALTKPGIQAWNFSAARLSQVQSFRSNYQEMLFEQFARDPHWESILRARLLDITIGALRAAHHDTREQTPAFSRGCHSEERVANYAVRMRNHFFRPECLDEVASSLGLSRRRFTELFRKVTGYSWKKYIVQLRLNHAKLLLARTSKSVVVIAHECGFGDLSHFNHAFKSSFQSSPSAYRDKHHSLHMHSGSKARETP